MKYGSEIYVKFPPAFKLTQFESFPAYEKDSTPATIVKPSQDSAEADINRVIVESESVKAAGKKEPSISYKHAYSQDLITKISRLFTSIGGSKEEDVPNFEAREKRQVRGLIDRRKKEDGEEFFCAEVEIADIKFSNPGEEEQITFPGTIKAYFEMEKCTVAGEEKDCFVLKSLQFSNAPLTNLFKSMLLENKDRKSIFESLTTQNFLNQAWEKELENRIGFLKEIKSQCEKLQANKKEIQKIDLLLAQLENFAKEFKKKLGENEAPSKDDIKCAMHIFNCIDGLEKLYEKIQVKDPNIEECIGQYLQNIDESFTKNLKKIIDSAPRSSFKQNAIAITTMALGVVLIVAGAALIAGGILGVGFSFGGSLAAIPLGGKIAMAGTSITAGGVATTLAAYKIHKNRKKENLSSAKALEVIRTAKEIEKISKALADNKKPKEVKGKKV